MTHIIIESIIVFISILDSVMTMMIKKSLVFNLPRPSVPIFIRGSTSKSVTPSTSNDDACSTSDANNNNDGTSSRITSRSSNGDNGSSSSSSTSTSWVNSHLDFPLRRIYCVGRNYHDHAIEMGGNPEEREAPFFFQKPSDAVQVCYHDRYNNMEDCLDHSSSCIIRGNNVSSTANNVTTSTSSEIPTTTIPYPSMTSSLHYEGEFIVAIGKDGMRIPPDQAMHHIYGYAVGCDLTRRDLQTEAKQAGRSWDAAKGFDYSCPISPIIPKEEIIIPSSSVERKNDLDYNNIEHFELTLKVNNILRQQSKLGNMIYSTSEVISNLSKLFRLRRGDIILTGTPAGVSQLHVGDVVSIACGELIPCEFVVGESEY